MTRDIVFFLEDNLDVLDSTASFFETQEVPTLRATAPSEAEAVLEKWHEGVRCAYIDKTLQRDQNAGVDFLIRARKMYPEIDFALLTAWNLDSTERQYLLEQQINLIEKTQIRPAELLTRYHRGANAHSIDRSDFDPLSEGVAAAAASSGDLLFSSRLQVDVLKRREARFVERVRRLAGDLVARLREDERFGETSIFIGASEYTTDELIQEICDGTELGLALVDAHFAELEALGQRVYGGSR